MNKKLLIALLAVAALGSLLLLAVLILPQFMYVRRAGIVREAVQALEGRPRPEDIQAAIVVGRLTGEDESLVQIRLGLSNHSSLDLEVRPRPDTSFDLVRLEGPQRADWWDAEGELRASGEGIGPFKFRAGQTVYWITWKGQLDDGLYRLSWTIDEWGTRKILFRLQDGRTEILEEGDRRPASGELSQMTDAEE